MIRLLWFKNRGHRVGVDRYGDVRWRSESSIHPMAGTGGIMWGIRLHPSIEPKTREHILVYVMYGRHVMSERVMREYRGAKLRMCSMVTERVMRERRGTHGVSRRIRTALGSTVAKRERSKSGTYRFNTTRKIMIFRVVRRS